VRLPGGSSDKRFMLVLLVVLLVWFANQGESGGL
jgi:hypothetical protein